MFCIGGDSADFCKAFQLPVSLLPPSQYQSFPYPSKTNLNLPPPLMRSTVVLLILKILNYSRNFYSLELREQTRRANAEVKASRDLVNAIPR